MPVKVHQRIEVGPTDYPRKRAEGRMVRMDRFGIVIQKTLDSRLRIYLHFPSQGFHVGAV